MLKAKPKEGFSLVMPVLWKALEQEGISWVQGSHLHSLALQVGKIHPGTWGKGLESKSGNAGKSK